MEIHVTDRARAPVLNVHKGENEHIGGEHEALAGSSNSDSDHGDVLY